MLHVHHFYTEFIVLQIDFYVCIKEFLEIFGLQNENLINSEEIDAGVWETKLVNTDLKDLQKF